MKRTEFTQERRFQGKLKRAVVFTRETDLTKHSSLKERFKRVIAAACRRLSSLRTKSGCSMGLRGTFWFYEKD